MAKLPELLELTGNESAAHLLTENEDISLKNSSEDEEESPAVVDFQCQQILDNLDKIVSHTINPSLVLSFATGTLESERFLQAFLVIKITCFFSGLELINGDEREMLVRKWKILFYFILLSR